MTQKRPFKANGPTSRAMVQRTERQAEAVKMRISGKSSVEIGEALGVTRKTAWELIKKAMEQRREEIAESVDTLRAIEAERIERNLSHLAERLEAGDPAAHRAAARWHELLAKLQGLNVQSDVVEGPRVIVVDSRMPWERGGEVVDGEVVEPPAIGSGEESGDGV